MWAHSGITEREEVGADGCFEVVHGGDGMCTEPGLDMGQWRDTLDFHAHRRLECGWRGRECAQSRSATETRSRGARSKGRGCRRPMMMRLTWLLKVCASSHVHVPGIRPTLLLLLLPRRVRRVRLPLFPSPLTSSGPCSLYSSSKHFDTSLRRPPWPNRTMTRPVTWSHTSSSPSSLYSSSPILSPPSQHPVRLFPFNSGVSDSAPATEPPSLSGCECQHCIAQRDRIRKREKGSLLSPKLQRR